MNILRRYEKLAFMEVTNKEGEATFKRMTGFTELTKSMNPLTYDRKYVDEKTERSDVVGYAPEYSFSKDVVIDDDVTNAIKNVFENELTGEMAQTSIVVVDLSAEDEAAGSFRAIKRKYSIIPDSEGGDDALALEGSFKACGELIKGTATSTDNWSSCTFVEDED